MRKLLNKEYTGNIKKSGEAGFEHIYSIFNREELEKTVWQRQISNGFEMLYIDQFY